MHTVMSLSPLQGVIPELFRYREKITVNGFERKGREKYPTRVPVKKRERATERMKLCRLSDFGFHMHLVLRRGK